MRFISSILSRRVCLKVLHDDLAMWVTVLGSCNPVTGPRPSRNLLYTLSFTIQDCFSYVYNLSPSFLKGMQPNGQNSSADKSLASMMAPT